MGGSRKNRDATQKELKVVPLPSHTAFPALVDATQKELKGTRETGSHRYEVRDATQKELKVTSPCLEGKNKLCLCDATQKELKDAHTCRTRGNT